MRDFTTLISIFNMVVLMYIAITLSIFDSRSQLDRTSILQKVTDCESELLKSVNANGVMIRDFAKMKEDFGQIKAKIEVIEHDIKPVPNISKESSSDKKGA